MKPDYWSVTFRIPYSVIHSDSLFHYLAGDLTYLPFTKSLSPELRLNGGCFRSSPTPMAYYNSRMIESMMFYHNTVTRPKKIFTNLFATHRRTLQAEDYGPAANSSYAGAEVMFDNGFDSTFFLFSLLMYLHCADAISPRPEGQAQMLAFAKKIVRGMRL